jgi:hypothetical protein
MFVEDRAQTWPSEHPPLTLLAPTVLAADAVFFSVRFVLKVFDCAQHLSRQLVFRLVELSLQTQATRMFTRHLKGRGHRYRAGAAVYPKETEWQQQQSSLP